MGFFPSAKGPWDGPQVDPLILGQLRSPMLTGLMNSQFMRAEMLEVANEIKRKWLAKYQRVARESGNLGSTARVTSHRRRTQWDNRWEAEFNVGGPKAPYAPEIEAEHHILADVLREMGYPAGGDFRVTGPPVKESTVTLYHRTSRDRAENIVSEGFKPGKSGYGYFTEHPDDRPGGLNSVVKAGIPRSLIEHDPASGSYRVRGEHLSDVSFEHHIADNED